MISDIVTEYMVEKKNSPADHVKKIAVALGAIMLCAALFVLSMHVVYFLRAVVIMAGIGVLYGGWYLMNNFNIEYEYCITNDCIDVDKIIARRDRKRVASAKCSAFEEFGRFDAKTFSAEKYTRVIRACDSMQSEDLCYFVYRHPSKGVTLVIFNGAEKVLAAMKNFVPRTMWTGVYQ